MRASLLHVWPALSFHFGLQPRDLYDLTPFELDAYLAALSDLNDAR